jgi:hypothetical protein
MYPNGKGVDAVYEYEADAREAACGDQEVVPLYRSTRWIAVSERMPDDETELLVAWAGTDQTVSYAVFRHVDGSGEQVWQDACGYDLKQPSHWMPLPAPPLSPPPPGPMWKYK